METVGAFEAKTHLARLLDRVAQEETWLPAQAAFRGPLAPAAIRPGDYLTARFDRQGESR